MSKSLESSTERRLRTFRCDLTFQLFTQQGAFWQLIEWTRKYTGINAESRIPPALGPRDVHFPQQLKSTTKSRTAIQMEAVREWMVLINSIHNSIVPIHLQIETLKSSSLDFWMEFLSACVIFDPPPDDLLGFAASGMAYYEDFVNPLNPTAAEEGGLTMLASPIRFLVDPNEALEVLEHHIARVKEEMREKHDQIINALHEKLVSVGIDIREHIYDLEYMHYFDRDEPLDIHLNPTPYITVDEQTTESDVRHAFRIIAAQLPERPKRAKPKREPLVCLQCAIWYDECGWSHERIATRMDWGVQRYPGTKPKSENVRQYIVLGRPLLKQGKRAA